MVPEIARLRPAAVTVVMAFGVVACTGPSESATARPSVSTAVQASCEEPSVSFGPLVRSVVVTEVSDAVQSSPDMPFTVGLRQVGSVVPAVEASAAVDKARVFAEFLKQPGPVIAPLGEASPRERNSGKITVSGDGAVVAYESVQQVRADFTYRCGSLPVTGPVSSWARPRSGLVQCDHPKQPSAEVVSKVAALAC